jgi:hypothetical protein
MHTILGLRSFPVSAGIFAACVLLLFGCQRSRDKSALPLPDSDPVAPVAVPVAAPAQQPAVELSHSVPAGTVVPVELKSVIDTANGFQGYIGGVVPTDVRSPDGRVAIPAGSRATILVRKIGRTGAISVLDLGLYSMNILGKEFTFSNGVEDASTLSFTEDAGKGPGHSAVHLQYGYELDFKLNKAVQLP